jgi:hypothetical protein
MEASTTPVTGAKPLIEFQEIGHNTYLYTPQAYTPNEPLILLFSWNAAAAKHIAKYTATYQKLFPTARIVLVRSYTSDAFHRRSAYAKLLTPAIDVVKEHTRTGGEILVHSFSNGGGNQLNEFAKAWRKREGTILAMRAQMLDSSPGKGSWRRSHAAILQSLPRTWLWRLFGSVALHIVLFLVFAFNTITGRENRMLVMCREMNDTAIFDVRVPRVYLYSKADLMVKADEVEEHADEAEAQGWAIKRMCFEKSPHVGHILEDAGKYWGAVLEAWKTGPRNGSNVGLPK